MKISHLSVAWIFLLFITGCGGGSNDTKGNYRFFHAIPDVRAIDIFVDDSLDFPDVPFRGSTGYTNFDEGETQIRINDANQFTELINTSVGLDGDKDYTLIALERGLDAELLIAEDDTSEPSDDRARLRFIHAARDSGAFDVYVTTPERSIPASVPSLDDFAFKDVSTGVESSAGSYRVRLTAPGQTQALVDSGTFTIAKGEVRTVVVTDAGSSFARLTFLTDRASK